jgi:serine/threonine protein kinase
MTTSRALDILSTLLQENADGQPVAILARVSTEPAKAELRAGDTLGPYRIDALLGEGGMGAVFRATRTDTGELVALKVIKLELAADTIYQQRFLHEARAAAEIEHRHLVNVLEVGEAEGRQYLSMPLMEGHTLEDRIAESGPLPVADAVRLAEEVGAGLDALHEREVIHRDIKPSNIMLAPDGTAALTDFGLAKGTGYSRLTQPGQIVGTLDYLAPERIRGEDATPASDIYALGCVTFEAVCGKAPFAHKSIMQVAFAHLEETPPNPCAERTDASQAFSEAILSALAKSPSDRPATATEYAARLRAAAG